MPLLYATEERERRQSGGVAFAILKMVSVSAVNPFPPLA